MFPGIMGNFVLSGECRVFQSNSTFTVGHDQFPKCNFGCITSVYRQRFGAKLISTGRFKKTI